MARLVCLLFNLSSRGLAKRGLHSCRLRKALIVVSLVFTLVVSTTALAQPRHGYGQAKDSLPPRPQQSHRPWPWFVAFILLGLACYPAFKNSKRELSE